MLMSLVSMIVSILVTERYSSAFPVGTGLYKLIKESYPFGL